MVFLEQTLPPLEDHLAAAGLLVKRADLSPRVNTVDEIAKQVERTWECASREDYRRLATGMPWLVAVDGKKDLTAAGVAKGLELMREDPPLVIVMNASSLTRHLLHRRIFEAGGLRRTKVQIVYPVRRNPLKMQAPMPLSHHGKAALKWWTLIGREQFGSAVWWNV